MAQRLDAREASFPGAFARLLATKREVSEDVDEAVRAIIEDVRERGDRALIDYTGRFDGLELTPETLRISSQEIDAAQAQCPPEELAALSFAKERIEVYHRAQRPQDSLTTDALGVTLGWRWTALESVGLYVPGGRASYPSSVLMNAVPAKVAGVPRIAMAVPTPRGETNPLVLAAARLAGVDEVFRIGGAQAIAALAYGAGSVRPVAKIVGPGNAYVAEAKRQVFGRVGIDMIAGPSEVVIVAEAGAAPPAWLAADLLAQAEHDERAQSILIGEDGPFLDAVAAEVEEQLRRLPRAGIAGVSWAGEGALIRVGRLEEAADLIDALAPEHLQLVGPRAEALAGQVRHAGAIFMGAHTPEVIGDYVGGPNHVLPTGRTARFASGLAVHDFLKRTTLLACGREQLQRLGPAAVMLARAEGLEAHARAVEIRLGQGG
jgi:histidinol dehydrogenase